MKEYTPNHIKTVTSAKATLDYIVHSNFADSQQSLKFITLSVDDFQVDNFNWAIELSNRSFNNLLNWKFTKKAIRESLRVIMKASPHSSTQRRRARTGD